MWIGVVFGALVSLVGGVLLEGYGEVVWAKEEYIVTKCGVVARFDFEKERSKWRGVFSGEARQVRLEDEMIIVWKDEIGVGYDKGNGSVRWTGTEGRGDDVGGGIWGVKGGVLKSERGVWKFEDENGGWEREEGLAHGVDVKVINGEMAVLTEFGDVIGVDMNGKMVWKVGGKGKCGMVEAEDGVGVVCVEGGKSVVKVVRGGKVVREEVVDFEAVEVGGGEKVRVLGEGRELGEVGRWLRWDGEGVWLESGGKEIWRIGGEVVGVVGGESGGSVRVTEERQVLYGYGDVDLVLVLMGGGVVLVVDVKTGSVVWGGRHEVEVRGGVGGGGWFVYWGGEQVFVLDFYRGGKGRVWKVVREWMGGWMGGWMEGLVGKEGGDNLQEEGKCMVGEESCVADDRVVKKFSTISSSFLVNGRIRNMAVTKTQLGVTERSVVILLQSGQVALVSKIWLDARRAKGVKQVDTMEFLWPYMPIFNLVRASSEVVYVAQGRRVHRAKRVVTASVQGMESASLIVVLGTDLMIQVVHPGGRFDALPDDFMYSAVVAMVAALSTGVWYTQRVKTRVLLSRAW